MKQEDIKKLINKYYQGETSTEEEKLLAEMLYIEENRSLDPELAELLYFYHQYQELESNDLEIKISPEEDNKTKVVHLPWYYSIAASVVFLLLGFIMGGGFKSGVDSDQKIAVLNSEINEIKSKINYQQVSNLSPSERIQVTFEAREADSLDLEAMNTLIELMIFDENTNVRLAAAEALDKFKGNDKVRRSYINALKKEEDPVVMIKLIDLLVKSNEKKAVPELERIFSSEDQNPAVRQKAASGINQLI